MSHILGLPHPEDIIEQIEQSLLGTEGVSAGGKDSVKKKTIVPLRMTLTSLTAEGSSHGSRAG